MRNAAWACNAIAACVLSLHAVAQVTKPAPCSGPEHRQFDFWLGDWEVRGPAGKLAGTNTITLAHNGCVLVESWKGNGGVTGSSLNVYDADRRKWRQVWVDSSGGILDLEGGFANGRMTLAGVADAKGSMSRITWEPLADGRVRQLWESSPDGGATWKVAFDGYYSKR